MILDHDLANIVGVDNVKREKGVLQEYSQDISFVNHVSPDCVIKARNSCDVQQIVNLARKTHTPLVPVSSGPPHFRGDTVPGTGGSTIIDLSGMKKVIRVDRENRIALFEPGVTFDELNSILAKSGLRLNMPLLPRKTKSVTASMLEREPVTMPAYHWDAADPLNCVEVIFGTGDIFRTGSAAGPGSIEEQWMEGGDQIIASGPSASSLYRIIQGAQGTMGIVTWASARCEILPVIEKPFMSGSPQLEKILEMVHWLIRLRLVNECFILSNNNQAAIMSGNNPDNYRQIMNRLPRWILFFNIAGYEYFPEERVSSRIKDMQDISQRLGLTAEEAIGGISANNILDMISRTSPEPYWKLQHKGACQDIFFLSNYKKIPHLIEIIKSETEKIGYPFSEIGIYLQPVVQGINCHCEFNLFYDPDNSMESARVKQLSNVVTRILIANGAFFSRPYGENTDLIMNYDAATVTALKKVKAILDPDNIMNPGKLCF